PPNAKVTLWFHSAGYITKDLSPIQTGTAAKLRVRPMPLILTKPKGDGLLASANARQSILSKIVEFGKATGALDIVMYDLGSIRQQVSGSQEALKEVDTTISDIKADKQFHPMVTPEREKIWLMFNQIIERNHGNPVEIEPESLLNLIRNESLPYGIRYDAVRVLHTLQLNPAVKGQMLIYFREQSRIEASLFMPATYALAMMGTDADKLTVIAGVNSDDPEQAIASITAIGNANLARGSDALARKAEEANGDASVRMAAIRSLDTLAASEQKQIAVGSLTRILSEIKNSEPVRIEAAEALRDVDLTRTERQTVERVANKDPSVRVRAAATGVGKVKLASAVQRSSP
ncbi:MAG: hypothetical protein M3R67_09980, partial [Acidobacteriota bacterium]|nr:hypothetical protein [Acidobacteriota bacterium]